MAKEGRSATKSWEKTRRKKIRGRSWGIPSYGQGQVGIQGEIDSQRGSRIAPVGKIEGQFNEEETLKTAAEFQLRFRERRS